MQDIKPGTNNLMEATNQLVSTAARLSIYKRLPAYSTICIDRSRYGLAIYSRGAGCSRHRRIGRNRAMVLLSFTSG